MIIFSEVELVVAQFSLNTRNLLAKPNLAYYPVSFTLAHR